MSIWYHMLLVVLYVICFFTVIGVYLHVRYKVLLTYHKYKLCHQTYPQQNFYLSNQEPQLYHLSYSHIHDLHSPENSQSLHEVHSTLKGTLNSLSRITPPDLQNTIKWNWSNWTGNNDKCETAYHHFSRCPGDTRQQIKRVQTNKNAI